MKKNFGSGSDEFYEGRGSDEKQVLILEEEFLNFKKIEKDS